jgi:Cys-tRNA(Pro)/Cys-tRNA(Cys) deacylase
MVTRGTPALEALRRACVDHRVHEYEVDDRTALRGGDRPAYGEDAARALGVDPDRIHKTLVATVDGEFVVAIVPVAGELDMKALTVALRGRRAAMADPTDAERVTCHVRGGISPLGQRRRLPTVLDAGALTWPTIFVSAGRRGVQVELAPAVLASLTSATIAPIRRSG